jgi:cytochrome c oxidase subunit IV
MAETKLTGRTYIGAWAALVALTAVSLGMSYVPLGPFSSAVAIAIAMVKAAVVLYVFMQLAEAYFATKMIAAVNVIFVALLCLGVAGDVAFR